MWHVIVHGGWWHVMICNMCCYIVMSDMYATCPCCWTALFPRSGSLHIWSSRAGLQWIVFVCVLYFFLLGNKLLKHSFLAHGHVPYSLGNRLENPLMLYSIILSQMEQCIYLIAWRYSVLIFSLWWEYIPTNSKSNDCNPVLMHSESENNLTALNMVEFLGSLSLFCYCCLKGRKLHLIFA